MAAYASSGSAANPTLVETRARNLYRLSLK